MELKYYMRLPADWDASHFKIPLASDLTVVDLCHLREPTQDISKPPAFQDIACLSARAENGTPFSSVVESELERQFLARNKRDKLLGEPKWVPHDQEGDTLP